MIFQSNKNDPWLETAAAYEIYRQCMYKPTVEKYQNEISSLRENPSRSVFVCSVEGKKVGIIALERQPGNTAEILGIAVEKEHFRRGIGTFMIQETTIELGVDLIHAETDRESVDFYRHAGFEICRFTRQFSDGEIVRYHCTLNTKNLPEYTQKKIELRLLTASEEEMFIWENQAAFDRVAIEEFGPQEESVIPRQDIENSLHKNNAEAFRIIADGEAVGGVIVVIDPETNVNSLDILFINPDCHCRGIGLKVWQMIEAKYPETKIWETHTPYFEKRNIHFYVNKCGFHIVEFFNPHHPEPCGPCDTPGGEYFFRFEKVIK